VETRTERLNTKAAGVIGLAVMCSRVLGLVREQVCAGLFGGGGAMDAFTAAFRIPNLLRDLFAEGALSTAFVTTFSKTIARGGDHRGLATGQQGCDHDGNRAGCHLPAGHGVLAAAGRDARAWDLIRQKAALTVTLTRIMFPFILLVSLAALVMGMLNAKNIFGMPAMASSFFNIGSIVGGVLLGYWLDPHFGPRSLIGLAVGTLIGGGLQLGVQLPQLRRIGFHYQPDLAWRDPGVSAILTLMGPSIIAASTTQVNVLINSMFASTLGDGRIFWLSIAFRLMQLPLGIFGVALGTVTLPLLSRLAVKGDTAAFRGELSRGMRLAFLLTVPSTVGLMMLSEPIISVLYQHGRFTAYEAGQAAGALRFYAIGLGGYAALKVLVNAFYALDQRKTPMLVSFMAVALNLIFNWIFTFQLGWGHRGLAFSTGLCGHLQLPGAVLADEAPSECGSRRVGCYACWSRSACPQLSLAAICWASQHWLLSEWATQHFRRQTHAI
jgi:putative peptidoglycan lipid II flippase